MEGGEDQVSGQGGMNGDFSCLGIPDLADEDDIRILTDNRSQGIGEGESDRRFDLNLIDPSQLILHGVFYRDDLLIGELIFPGHSKGWSSFTPRRARDENDSVRPMDQVSEPVHRVFRET